MMGNADCGEPSTRRDQEEHPRPLKKAKYIWQVKGKYHLKAENSSRLGDNGGNSCAMDSHVNKFLAKTDTILDTDDDEEPTNIDKAIYSEIPVTLVSPDPKNQDYYLKKWQARQIGRGYIDNAINSVLETWVSVPFNAEDFVDNCDFDGRVEDKGILMAIESHGLQSIDERESWSFVKPDVDTARMSPVPEKNPDLDVVYPVDILNAAILVAIEKKGLSKKMKQT